MDWIKTLPCCACGTYGNSDPAHTKVFGSGGMGQKSSDRSCVPLCRPCHHEFDHGMRRLDFESDHEISIREIVLQLNEAYNADIR